MDQVRVSLTRVLVDENTLRIKFDIVCYRDRGAEHYGFVRFFALINDNVSNAKSRDEIAAVLRTEHRAAWERFHRYVE